MYDFNHTVNVLVKAYLNDTLIHGHCGACVVGNMVADAGGGSGLVDNGCCAISDGWGMVFVSTGGFQYIYPDNYVGKAKHQIDATGYSWQELARIEKAFESAKGGTKDDRMFNGLMAVVDVLADIHKVSLEQVKEAKSLFV